MEKVHLSFKYTEEEYLAASRLFLLRSTGNLVRLVLGYSLVSVGLTLMLSMATGLPLWFIISLFLLVGIALFHGFVYDLPRRQFRGDPKFRDEYNLIFSGEGIRLRTTSIDASFAWSLYTRVIENEKFYLFVYGKGIGSVSVLPKRVFVDSGQEQALRELLRQHINQFSREKKDDIV